MTKLGIISVLALATFLSGVLGYQTVYAADIDIIDPSVCSVSEGPQPEACNIENPNKDSSDNILVGPNGMITRLAKWLVYISGALAAILIIIAGLMFIFSQGNPESAGRARRTVLYALIGVVVAVVGQAIISFVLIRLGE